MEELGDGGGLYGHAGVRVSGGKRWARMDWAEGNNVCGVAQILC